MATKKSDSPTDDELDFDAPASSPVEMEVREFASGLRLKMKKQSTTEERYELPCGVEVIKRRGTGEDMTRIIRQAGSKADRISGLLIHYLIDFVDEDGKRVKMHVEDIQSLDIEDYLALQELVNPEKKAHRIQDSI
jgi:hypothetical protein